MGGYISSVFFYQLGIGVVFKIVMKALMQRLYIHYQASYLPYQAITCMSHDVNADRRQEYDGHM